MSGTTINGRVVPAAGSLAASDSSATNSVEQVSAFLESAMRVLAQTRLSATDSVCEEPFVTPKELAQHFSVQQSWVYRRVQQDASFPSYRFGKYLRFRVSEVEAWAGRQPDDSVGRGR